MPPRNVTYQATEDAVVRAIGYRIRQARNNAGYSLKELEEMSEGGFKASVVGAYERGERNITAVRLVILAGLLGTSAVKLMWS